MAPGPERDPPDPTQHWGQACARALSEVAVPEAYRLMYSFSGWWASLAELGALALQKWRRREMETVELSGDPLFNGVFEQGRLRRGRSWGPASHKAGCRHGDTQGPLFISVSVFILRRAEIPLQGDKCQARPLSLYPLHKITRHPSVPGTVPK